MSTVTMPRNEQICREIVAFIGAQEAARIARIDLRINEHVAEMWRAALRRPSSSLVGRMARDTECVDVPVYERYRRLMESVNSVMRISLPDWESKSSFDVIDASFRALQEGRSERAGMPQGFVGAASGGDRSAFRRVDPLDPTPVPRQSYQKTLVNAPESGESHLIRDIRKRAPSMSQEERGNMLFEFSTRKGRVECIRKMYVRGYTVSKAVWRKAFWRAVDENNAELIGAVCLFAYGNAVGRVWRRAFIVAAKRGHLHAVQEIYLQASTVLDAEICAAALQSAAGAGHMEVACKLCELTGYQLNKREWRKAVAIAEKNGHVELARCMRSGRAFQGDSALLAAIEGERLGEVRKIVLLAPSLNANSWQRVVAYAAARGYADIVCVACECAPDAVDAVSWRQAVDLAVENNHAEVVKALQRFPQHGALSSFVDTLMQRLSFFIPAMIGPSD